MDKNAPIGIFDSGVGGLTVAREVMPAPMTTLENSSGSASISWEL